MKEIVCSLASIQFHAQGYLFFFNTDIFILTYKTFKQLATRTLVDQICSMSCKETVVISLF